MKKISILEWIITLALATCLTFFACWLAGAFEAKTNYELYEALCNGTFGIGFLMICFAGLMWCSHNGVFNGLTFGVKQLFVVMRSDKALREKETYAEYCEKKRAKAPPVLAHLLLIGGVLIVASIVFLMLYEATYVPPSTPQP